MLKKEVGQNGLKIVTMSAEPKQTDEVSELETKNMNVQIQEILNGEGNGFSRYCSQTTRTTSLHAILKVFVEARRGFRVRPRTLLLVIVQ